MFIVGYIGLTSILFFFCVHLFKFSVIFKFTVYRSLKNSKRTRKVKNVKTHF